MNISTLEENGFSPESLEPKLIKMPFTFLGAAAGRICVEGCLEDVNSANETDSNPELQEVEYLSFNELETIYRQSRNLESERNKCRKLVFKKDGQEITDLIGYNATQPILDKYYDTEENPYFILRVRMEKIDDEKESKVVAFRASSLSSTEWEQVEDDNELPKINGQDPSLIELGDELFLGVIEVESVPDDSDSGYHLKWWQRFYMGKDVRNMIAVGRGPDGMKNVTPVMTPTSGIVTFTRPQNPDNEALGGLGQIGEVTRDKIDEILKPDVLQAAELINTRFINGREWGGIKYGLPLIDGKIGVLGHIACYDINSPLYNPEAKDKPKKYATFVGTYDPRSRKLENVKLVAMADEFPSNLTKDESTRNVVYTTGMTEPDENGRVLIIQGVRDAETWSKEIDDPFAGHRVYLPRPGVVDQDLIG
jgi:hypothetical protein